MILIKLNNIRFWLFFFLFTTTSITLSAQKLVTGVVTDAEDNSPLPGVSIKVDGTSQAIISNDDGRYSIKIPEGKRLIFSMMGYRTVTHEVKGEVLNVDLLQDVKKLNEVIVTAMGIKRDLKALGYSAQEIKGNELLKVKTPNLVNSLNGKISGVNITNSSGAPGASSQIIIRGGTSLLNDNQPLFVVDGLPIDNSTAMGNTATDGMGATASGSGNRAMDINPDDIESISVLKGASASALYGLRAANGAIIITTKKGKEGTPRVRVTARMSIDKVNRLPKIQELYGQGTQGGYNKDSNLSWGEMLGENTVIYKNLKDFFQTAFTYDVNSSVSGGTKSGNYYLSVQRLDQTGVVPMTDYVKNSFRLNIEQTYGILTFGMLADYINSFTSKTLTGAGLYKAGGSGFLMSILNWPITNNMKVYLNPDGSKKRLLSDMPLEEDLDNPYWLIHNCPITETLDRFIGNTYVEARPVSWLKVIYRMGIDHYNSQTKNVLAPGAAIEPIWQKGTVSLKDCQNDLLTSNFLIYSEQQIGDFNLNFMLGHAYEQLRNYNNTERALGMLNPEFISINGASVENKIYDNFMMKRRLISLFGEARFGYKSIAYISVTGRNDWSSTLPKENRSFFYPSISGSFLFNELIPKKKILSFGKVRVSYAQVGKDAPPYKTLTSLDPPLNTIGGGYRDSWTGGNPDLKPEKSVSWEIGFDLRFLQGRIGIDGTYYNNKSSNQIIQPRLSNAIGYIFKYINAGEITNKGIELTLSGSPVRNANWNWDMQLNLSHNKGRVNHLIDGMDILYVTDVQVGPAKPASFNGGYFLGISGQLWQQTPDGYTLIDAKGYPVVSIDQTKMLGNREPKLLIGLNNTISYKNLALSFLLDMRIGGIVYNATEQDMINSGQSTVTLNRGTKTIIPGQVKNDDGTFSPNNTEIMLDDFYYRNYYVNHAPFFLTDVNWFRLRSLSLTWNVPVSICKRIGFVKQADVSLSSHNLFLLTNYKGADPEVSAGGAAVVGAGSSGIDYYGVPSTRTFSLGINITF